MRISCVARYKTIIRSPWSSARAFDYMADVRNFGGWDPSIRRVVQVSGEGGGEATEFDIEVPQDDFTLDNLGSIRRMVSYIESRKA